MKNNKPEPYTDQLRQVGHALIIATDVHGMFNTGMRFRSERIDYQSPWFGTMDDLFTHLQGLGKDVPPIWSHEKASTPP